MNNNLLSGLTIVDISQNLPGPYCSYLFLKMGATVIKVESPIKPDPAKLLPAFYKKINDGKQVLTLDLKTNDGLASFYDIIKNTDIVIEGSRPGVAKKLKVDFDTLSVHKPDLIYCSISGYGQNSPKREIPAHDLNMQAEAGLLSFFDNPKDSVCVIPIADLTASHNAYSSILAALHGRKADKAMFIDISMGETMTEMVDVWKSTIPTSAHINAQLDKVKFTSVLPGINPFRAWIHKRLAREPLSALPHYDVFRCRDNQWIALGIVGEQHFWIELCEQFGGLFTRLKTLTMEQRILLGPILKRLIRRKFDSNTRVHWVNKLRGIPISSV
jgi:crotonobetainyl-CoA:carnitine CoA-transferase CaiB-like acyl-CoA transferase